MKNYALCALGNETFRVPKESKVLLFLVTGTVLVHTLYQQIIYYQDVENGRNDEFINKY